MSLVRMEFNELYGRHCCRHSQFGINVNHLVALFGVWFAVYAFLHSLTQSEWVPVGLGAAYLLALAPNVPLRVWVATLVFMAGFVAAVLLVPALPRAWCWAYLPLVPLFYKVQAWGHRRWTVARDMTAYNRKYSKGWLLFCVLLLTEVPLALNYLVFDRKNWAR
jgi:hypothetical protein